MYAITGAFGQTGQAVCNTLLAQGQPIRMIVRRDDAQADAWRRRGAEVVVADLLDRERLTQALAGAAGAYLMNPPAYFVDDLFAHARAVHASLVAAASAAGVPHVVALSSVGAQHASGTGNILTTHDFERQLEAFTGRITVLRAANFMENWAWSSASVVQQGLLPSMFRPLDRALPMVSAADIGATAAALLQDTAIHMPARRIVELHGPAPASPDGAAAAFAAHLGRPVRAVEADPGLWAKGMREQGFPASTVAAFVEMFDGFNRGHVRFEGTHETRRGSVPLATALASCLPQAPQQGQPDGQADGPT